jgi:hypothetical protein
MPDALLREIDARVGQRRRSEFIQEAIEEKLALMRRVEAFDRVVGSIADGDVPAWETRESTAQWVRGLRQRWDTQTNAMLTTAEDRARRSAPGCQHGESFVIVAAHRSLQMNASRSFGRPTSGEISWLSGRDSGVRTS